MVKLDPQRGTNKEVLFYEINDLTTDENWSKEELETLDHYVFQMEKKDVLLGLRFIYNKKYISSARRKGGRKNKVQKHYELIERHLKKDPNKGFEDISHQEMTEYYIEKAKKDLSRTSFWRLKKLLAIEGHSI